jgi:hypothetical protein|tara:strand:- start:362 stop:1216 length:855 start_codon:yes stop_codon:yes gene_type:complete
MIKHNKIKNTAFLYECLTRQITSDVLSNNDPSPALAIVKEFFKPTTILGKELVLYKALTSKKLKNEGKINYLVDSVLRERAKLNYSEMRRAKYNLVKKITEKYDLKDFFRTRISNYRDIASVYKLFEIQHNSNPFEETEIRFVVMENLKEKDAPKSNKQSVVEKFQKESKDLRLLSYKILVDKFNQKYSNLNESQRGLLQAYINNISNTSTLKDFMAEEIKKLKNEILKIHPKIDDKVVSIKLKECLNVLKKLNKGNVVNEEQLVTMMRFYSLLDEINAAVNKS